MAGENLVSASITNMDAIPPVRNTSGQGGKGALSSVYDYVTTTTGKDDTSTYRLVRVRSNIVVKQVLLSNAAMSTSAAMNVGVYYSNDPLDPNYPTGAGAAISHELFASSVSVATAATNTDITNESTNYTIAIRNEPLWQAAGLSADPGGYFDIVAEAATTVTAGGLMGLELRFVDPGD